MPNMSAATQLRRLKDLGQTEIRSFFHNLEHNDYARWPVMKDGYRLPKLTLSQVMNLPATRPFIGAVVSVEYLRQMEIYKRWRVFCLNQLEDGKSPARTAAWTELRNKIHGSNNTVRVVKVSRPRKTPTTKHVSSPRCGQCDKIGHNKRTCPIIARKQKRAKVARKRRNGR